MVERMEDKTSTCGHILLDKEKVAWKKLKDVLNIEKPTSSQHELKFSSGNLQQNSVRVFTRLDMVYMTKGSIGQILKAFQYFVKGNASKLDHQPISSDINIMGKKKGILLENEH